MRLIRDVLDNQLVDREGRKMGKVDGIVVVLRESEPPRLACIETGGTTLAHRLHTRLGKWAEKVGRKWGVRRGLPFRIAWKDVRDVGIEVEVNLEANETPVMDWEKWLNKNVIGRIPGSG
jgi:hypothetical protein